MTRNRLKMNVFLMSAALFGVTMPSVLEAQESDYYLAAGGTVSALGSRAGTVANAPMPGMTVRLEEKFDPGFGAFVALGRRFGSFRVEGELGYTRDTADRYTAIVPATGEVLGDIRSQTLRAMANGFVDFKVGGLEPFVGAGIGYATTDFLVISPRAVMPTEQARRLIDDTDSGFAYQAMAGVAVPVNERLRITLGYRWFDEGEFEGVDGRNQKITRERGAHNVDVGLRWNF